MRTKEELEQELKTLKAKYGTVYSVTIALNEDKPNETATIFLKKSDRITTAIVRKFLNTDPTKSIEAGLKNLYIGGDDLNLIVTNDDALLGCESALVEIMNKQEAVLKKN